MEKLTSKEIDTRLARLNQGLADSWSIESGKLHKSFVFPNFIEAFGFMSRAAIIAESMNHHPEWSNVYKRVVIDLVTHEAGGITQLDFDLAQRLQQLA